MTTIKHFVITRFLSEELLGFKEKIFDEKTLKTAYDYVNNFFIKTLENQTNHNFEIIFIINDKHNINANIFKQLKNISTIIKCSILKKSDLYNYIKSFYYNYDYIITTNLDYDDLLSNDIINDIQSKTDICVKHNLPILITGYIHGATMVIGDTNIHEFNELKYGKYGYFSCGLSLIINTKVDLNICCFNQFKGGHGNIKRSLKNDICPENNIKFNDLMIDENEKDDINYIWVRHKNTGSELSLNESNTHRSAKIITISDFYKKYGYNIW